MWIFFSGSLFGVYQLSSSDHSQLILPQLQHLKYILSDSGGGQSFQQVIHGPDLSGPTHSCVLLSKQEKKDPLST